jgi:hypothetical protein
MKPATYSVRSREHAGDRAATGQTDAGRGVALIASTKHDQSSQMPVYEIPVYCLGTDGMGGVQPVHKIIAARQGNKQAA